MRRSTPAVRRQGNLATLAMALSVVFSLALLLGSQQEVSADQDLVVRVQFLRWSGINPDVFLVRQLDAVRGNKLEVRQCGNPAPILSIEAPPEEEAKIVNGGQLQPYSFVVGAFAGTKAPNGWKVFAQKEGTLMRIGLASGAQTMQLGVLQAKTDAQSGGHVDMEMTTAYWSEDSHRVVVIVKHKTTGAWAMDIEEAHGFKIGG